MNKFPPKANTLTEHINRISRSLTDILHEIHLLRSKTYIPDKLYSAFKKTIMMASSHLDLVETGLRKGGYIPMEVSQRQINEFDDIAMHITPQALHSSELTAIKNTNPEQHHGDTKKELVYSELFKLMTTISSAIQQIPQTHRGAITQEDTLLPITEQPFTPIQQRNRCSIPDEDWTMTPEGIRSINSKTRTKSKIILTSTFDDYLAFVKHEEKEDDLEEQYTMLVFKANNPNTIFSFVLPQYLVPISLDVYTLIRNGEHFPEALMVYIDTSHKTTPISTICVLMTSKKYKTILKSHVKYEANKRYLQLRVHENTFDIVFCVGPGKMIYTQQMRNARDWTNTLKEQHLMINIGNEGASLTQQFLDLLLITDPSVSTPVLYVMSNNENWYSIDTIHINTGIDNMPAPKYTEPTSIYEPNMRLTRLLGPYGDAMSVVSIDENNRELSLIAINIKHSSPHAEYDTIASIPLNSSNNTNDSRHQGGTSMIFSHENTPTNNYFTAIIDGDSDLYIGHAARNGGDSSIRFIDIGTQSDLYSNVDEHKRVISAMNIKRHTADNTRADKYKINISVASEQNNLAEFLVLMPLIKTETL